MRDPKLVSICILKHGIIRTWHEPTGSSWDISRDTSSARSSKLWSQASFGRKPCALGSSAIKPPIFFDKRSVEVQFYPTKPFKNQCKHLMNGGLKKLPLGIVSKGSVTSWYVMFVGFKRSQRFVINGDIFRDKHWPFIWANLPNIVASMELSVIIFTVSSAVFHLRFMQIVWISSTNHQNIIWKSCVNCELLFDGFFSQTYFTRNMRQDTYTATSHQGGAEVASSNHNLWTWRFGRVQLATRGIGWVHRCCCCCCCCCCCWILLIIVTIYVRTYDSFLNDFSWLFCYIISVVKNAYIYNIHLPLFSCWDCGPIPFS